MLRNPPTTLDVADAGAIQSCYPIITGALTALLLNPGHTPENSVSSAIEMQGIITPCADVTLLCKYPKEVALELGKAGDPYRFRVFEHPHTRFLRLERDLKFLPNASPQAQGDLFNRVLAIAEANNHTARFGVNRLVLIVDAVTTGFDWRPENRPPAFTERVEAEKTVPALPDRL